MFPINVLGCPRVGGLEGFGPQLELDYVLAAFAVGIPVHMPSPKYARTSSGVARQQLTRGAPTVWHRMTPAIRARVGHLMISEAQAEKSGQRIAKVYFESALRGRHLVV